MSVHTLVQDKASSGPGKHTPGAIPLTPMNPDYEYDLPPHLALVGSLLEVDSSTMYVSIASAAACQTPTSNSTGTVPAALACDHEEHCNHDGTCCAWTTSSGSDNAHDHPHEAKVEEVAGRSVLRASTLAGESDDSARSTGLAAQDDRKTGKFVPSPLVPCTTGRGLGPSPRAGDGEVCTSPPEHLGKSTIGRGNQEQWVHWQLNQFTKDDVFLGRFEVLGQRQRRRGGVSLRGHKRYWTRYQLNLLVCDCDGLYAARMCICGHTIAAG